MTIFVVNTALDVVNGSDGLTSLREAVAAANANADTDTITFAAGLTGQTLILTGGELALTNDVTIDGDVNGDDKADITISGNDASRIFNISGATTDIDIKSLTLINGNAGVGGARGGAILATSIGSLDFLDTTIRDSTASGNGGGMYISGPSAVSLTNSLLTSNTTSNYGGGLYAFGGAVVTVTNSTVHGNSAEDGGGGLSVGGASLTLLNSTVTGNRADSDGNGSGTGGGLDRFGGTASITATNSVVADNLKGTGNVEDDVTNFVNTATNSVFGTNVTINTNNASQVNIADVGLANLTDNGGTVLTRSPLTGSVLINNGSTSALPNDIHDVDGDGIFGEALPQDGRGAFRVADISVDVGAVEFGSSSPVIVVTTTSDVVDGNDGIMSLREAVTLANNSPEAVTIVFSASLAGQNINLTGGELVLTNDETVDGDSNGDDRADVTISGNNASRIFNITGASTDVELLSLTLTDGVAGAGIVGGAVCGMSARTLTIAHTTIDGNSAQSGGGLYTRDTVVTLTNSLLAANTSYGSGGALTFIGGSVALTNSTVHGNFANGNGGGMYFAGLLRLYNTTVTSNHSDVDGGGGGGIRMVHGNMIITNSVVAANRTGLGAVADDVSGIIATANSSVFGTAVTITTNSGSSTGVANVALGQLLDNGGTVLTRSPLDGSVLIERGSNAALPFDVNDIDNDGNTAEVLPIDGRGGVRIVGAKVDAGAVEQIVNEIIGGTVADDNILGGLGNDILRGRGGNDTLDGGAGTSDTVDYSEATGTGVTVNLNTLVAQFVSTSQGFDTFTGIENVTGSSLNDVLTGNGSANIIDGGLGNDTMAGGGGNDTYFDNLGDTVSEALGAGSDTVNTTRNTYALPTNVERVNFVGSGNFVGTGTNINNRFQGGIGDDRFVDVLGGNDVFAGNAGTDTIDFRSSSTAAIIDLSTNVHGGAAAGDSYSGIEKFLGSNTAGDTMSGGGSGRWVFVGGGGDDTLTGGVKNDQLIGQGGSDTLSGGSDRDSLDGGTGNDTLTGGAAGDVFVFIDAIFGTDTISDYQDGLDSFKVFSAVADNINDFTITNNNSTSVTLTLGANTITVNGVAPITIAADDFVFY